ncbi:hypothetical protein NGRA_2695 [Nosema granulosis]|uniref:Uncharacterized protein n=1 Tax=Nosema granulosis TaxID=83296 RepID=A0A9P6GW70_9MICR|nr:hypothetical protein NGRA_2695 [Nosema granulosis]
MATAVKTVKPFGGEEEEDVEAWLRKLTLIGEVAQWSENEMCRVVIMSLKGKALSRASQVQVGKVEMLDFTTIRDLIKKRFGSSSRSEISLTRFIELEIPKTRAEYSAILRSVTNIYERDIIKLQVLAQIVVKKVPGEIRALLYQKGMNAVTWEQFIQVAEEMAIISFPEKILSRVESDSRHQLSKTRGDEQWEDSRGGSKRGTYTRYNSGYEQRNTRRYYGAPYCILHGVSDHFTNECRMVTEMIGREKGKLNKTFARIKGKENNWRRKRKNKIKYYLLF